MARIFRLSCTTTFVLLAMHGASVISSHIASLLGMHVLTTLRVYIPVCQQRAHNELFLEPVEYDAVSATS